VRRGTLPGLAAGHTAVTAAAANPTPVPYLLGLCCVLSWTGLQAPVSLAIEYNTADPHEPGRHGVSATGVARRRRSLRRPSSAVGLCGRLADG
jgi:hypothetical protein